jgi:hypothetical protein
MPPGIEHFQLSDKCQVLNKEMNTAQNIRNSKIPIWQEYLDDDTNLV